MFKNDRNWTLARIRPLSIRCSCSADHSQVSASQARSTAAYGSTDAEHISAAHVCNFPILAAKPANGTAARAR